MIITSKESLFLGELALSTFVSVTLSHGANLTFPSQVHPSYFHDCGGSKVMNLDVPFSFTKS